MLVQSGGQHARASCKIRPSMYSDTSVPSSGNTKIDRRATASCRHNPSSMHVRPKPRNASLVSSGPTKLCDRSPAWAKAPERNTFLRLEGGRSKVNNPTHSAGTNQETRKMAKKRRTEKRQNESYQASGMCFSRTPDNTSET